jgi:hypothetical protein
LNRKRRKERGNEPFIIGIYNGKFITWEEIIQVRKEREEKAYEIYVENVSFKKKEIIIEDKKSKKRFYDIIRY